MKYLRKSGVFRTTRGENVRESSHTTKEGTMSSRIARVTEIIAGSPNSFDDAIKLGFERATKTLRGITGLKVVEFKIAAEDAKILEYRVRLEVIFLLEN